jgi:hypothetical protein
MSQWIPNINMRGISAPEGDIVTPVFGGILALLAGEIDP